MIITLKKINDIYQCLNIIFKKFAIINHLIQWNIKLFYCQFLHSIQFTF